MSHGFCPGCASRVALVGKRQAIARHGFTSWNVRHGGHGGQHVGRCTGSLAQPIGTAGGDATALDIAARLDAKAIATRAPLTTEETLAAMRVYFTRLLARFPGDRRVVAGAAGTIDPAEVEASRQARMRKRAAEAAAMVELAGELRRLVAEPAARAA